MDSGQPLDHGQGALSAHDHPAALSLREAAAQAGVTEKTIRRWIKSDRLVAQMRNGQYWIMVDALERAQAAPPRAPGSSTQDQRDDDQTMSMDTPRVHGHDFPGVDLQPLVDHIARLEGKVQELTEAATAWQFRALQAEERMHALEAGPLVQPDAPVAANQGPGEAMPAVTTDDASRADASRWGRFWRALTGR